MIKVEAGEEVLSSEHGEVLSCELGGSELFGTKLRTQNFVFRLPRMDCLSR